MILIIWYIKSCHCFKSRVAKILIVNLVVVEVYVTPLMSHGPSTAYEITLSCTVRGVDTILIVRGLDDCAQKFLICCIQSLENSVTCFQFDVFFDMQVHFRQNLIKV